MWWQIACQGWILLQNEGVLSGENFSIRGRPGGIGPPSVNVTFKYKEGRKNVVADCLSRLDSATE